MNVSRIALLISLLLLLPAAGYAQRMDKTALRRAIEEIRKESGARIGVAASRFAGGTSDSFQYNGGGRFPMQSVYKLPLALAVLDEISGGRQSFMQNLAVTQEELDSNTWSPMAKQHPEDDFIVTVAELLRYTVSQSDNIACDILFRLIGGPASVQRYLDRNKLMGMKVVSTEAEMHRDSRLQYKNWSTPVAMLELLRQIHRGDLLKGEQAAFLNIALTQSGNSPDRIGGRLPKGRYTLAHKTGTSGTDAAGFTAAVNDVGMVTVRDTTLGIAIFISDYRGDVAAGEASIAKISRLLWDYYMPE